MLRLKMWILYWVPRVFFNVQYRQQPKYAN